MYFDNISILFLNSSQIIVCLKAYFDSTINLVHVRMWGCEKRSNIKNDKHTAMTTTIKSHFTINLSAPAILEMLKQTTALKWPHLLSY